MCSRWGGPAGGDVKRYEPGLDGVRALAVVAVLAFHDGRLAGGFLGVSTFFTLSGFLITGLLLARVARRRAGLAAPLLRAADPAPGARGAGGRARRRRGRDRAARRADVEELPARRARRHRRLRELAAARVGPVVREPLRDAVTVAALLVARSRGAVLPGSGTSDRCRTGARARGRRAPVFAVLAAIGALSFVDGWTAAAHGIDRAYYGTDTRAVEFLVGSLLAIALADRKLGRRTSRAVAMAGPVALAAMIWANTEARVGDRVLFRGGLLAVRGHRMHPVARRVRARPDPVAVLHGATPPARTDQLRRLRVPLAHLLVVDARAHRIRSPAAHVRAGRHHAGGRGRVVRPARTTDPRGSRPHRGPAMGRDAHRGHCRRGVRGARRRRRLHTGSDLRGRRVSQLGARGRRALLRDSSSAGTHVVPFGEHDRREAGTCNA